MIAVLPLQFSVRTSTVLDAAAEIGGLAVIAAAVAGTVAIGYRWYARERVSNPPAVLIALATVALYLNATTALGQVMDGAAALTVRAATFNVSALVAGAVVALLGTTVGDHLAKTVLGGTDQVAVDESVSRVVRAVGRVIAVELPETIEDVPGYDPVAADTKATLEGKTFVFPRGLTVEALRDRVSRRLREDYRVGHVDIEIDDDGTVTHLGVGSRAAGIGPTLPPESAAMAVRADPAYAASPGDLVQVWERNPKRRLLNAEVRGTAGDVVTLAIDAADASKLSTDERYKLATLPVEQRADRELTELLRAADETLGVVEIDEGSPLAGGPVGAFDVTVVAIHAGGPDDHIEALPASDRIVSGGDSVYIIARPDAIRQIESAGTADAAGVTASSTMSEVGAGVVDQEVDTGGEDQAEDASVEDEEVDTTGEDQIIDTGSVEHEGDPTGEGQGDAIDGETMKDDTDEEDQESVIDGETVIDDTDEEDQEGIIDRNAIKDDTEEEDQKGATKGEAMTDDTDEEGQEDTIDGEDMNNDTDGATQEDDNGEESQKEDTGGNGQEADNSLESFDEESVDRDPE